jgi:hypothetical protein
MADSCTPAIRNIYLQQEQGRIVRYRPKTPAVNSISRPQNSLVLTPTSPNKKFGNGGPKMYTLRGETSLRTNYDFSLPRTQATLRPTIRSDGGTLHRFRRFRLRANLFVLPQALSPSTPVSTTPAGEVCMLTTCSLGRAIP